MKARNEPQRHRDTEKKAEKQILLRNPANQE
jgi:hypothetical protein